LPGVIFRKIFETTLKRDLERESSANDGLLVEDGGRVNPGSNWKVVELALLVRLPIEGFNEGQIVRVLPTDDEVPGRVVRKLVFDGQNSAEDVSVVDRESVFPRDLAALEAAGASVALEDPGVVRTLGSLGATFLAVLTRSVIAGKVAVVEVTSESPIFAFPIDQFG
jgi:hypothetical protein